MESASSTSTIDMSEFVMYVFDKWPHYAYFGSVNAPTVKYIGNIFWEKPAWRSPRTLAPKRHNFELIVHSLPTKFAWYGYTAVYFLLPMNYEIRKFNKILSNFRFCVSHCSDHTTPFKLCPGNSELHKHAWYLHQFNFMLCVALSKTRTEMPKNLVKVSLDSFQPLFWIKAKIEKNLFCIDIINRRM